MPDGGAASGELYRELVVERARRPLHAGVLDDADGTGTGTNPLCGDNVQISLRRDEAGRLREIRHRTRGCAICAAAADLLAETASERDEDQVAALGGSFKRLLEGGADQIDEADRSALGFLLALSDLHEYPSRRKCALLPFSALDAALLAAKQDDAGSGEQG